MKASEIRQLAQRLGLFVDRLERRAQTDLEMAEKGQTIVRWLDALANEETRHDTRKRTRT